MLDRKKLGAIGEEIAKKRLILKGHNIIGSNITSKYGEIDLVSIKNNIVHYVEVKSVTVGDIKPEEHFDWKKARKLRNLSLFHFNQLINDGKVSEEASFVVDLCSLTFSKDGVVVKEEYLDALEI